MAATKFTPERRAKLLEAFAAGCSITDAATANDLRPKTLKNWITRGRRDESGPYSEFALAVEVARTAAAEADAPMDLDELRLAVSKSARAGNVQAQKLMWEMIRADDGDEGEEPQDGFDALDQSEKDELAKARAKRGAA